MRAVQPGDWLDGHQEEGQTFYQCWRVKPPRRGDKLTTIYLLLLGDFSPQQREILATTQEYLATFYQTPVKLLRELPLDVIPEEGRRMHPEWDVPQIRSSYVLEQLLRPERPEDALAYLCFTASDLCSNATHNYVMGEARTWDLIGAWSIYRCGDPAESRDAYERCLRRMMFIATHETGHIMAIKHCTAFQCNMNGANSPSETDRHPLHFCPVCLRKLLWNLDAEPAKYHSNLEQFCRERHLTEEAEWYAEASLRLKH
jgi:archaemetzincin